MPWCLASKRTRRHHPKHMSTARRCEHVANTGSMKELPAHLARATPPTSGDTTTRSPVGMRFDAR